MTSVSTRVLISISLVVVGVGIADAAISREWDLLAIFVLVGLVLALLWTRQRATRLPVTLRPDLAHALEREAQRNAEPFDEILDRAVAWYHHGLYSDATIDDD